MRHRRQSSINIFSMNYRLSDHGLKHATTSGIFLFERLVKIFWIVCSQISSPPLADVWWCFPIHAHCFAHWSAGFCCPRRSQGQCFSRWNSKNHVRIEPTRRNKYGSNPTREFSHFMTLLPDLGFQPTLWARCEHLGWGSTLVGSGAGIWNPTFSTRRWILLRSRHH